MGEHYPRQVSSDLIHFDLNDVTCKSINDGHAV